MHILYIFADSETEWNCSEWRCLGPSSALNASKKASAKLLYLNSFIDYSNHAVQDIVGPADIIVIQRNFIIPQLWNAIEYWRGLHKAIAADLDDGYPTLPWSNPAHQFWLENKVNLEYPPIELLTQGLRRCDALLSPSRVILEDWKQVVPGVHLPNFAQGDWYTGLRPRPSDNKIVIGWGGSVSHYDSFWFSGVQEGLIRVCKERPNVVVKICGNDGRIYDQLNVPEEQKIKQPGVKAQDWPKQVATFDIGIAPLDLREGYDSYDQRRSWIKGLEYMLCGIPWVASRSEPYRDMFDYGLFVDNTPDEWADTLITLIDNLGKARKVARKHRQRAWQWTVQANIGRMLQAYESILTLRRSSAGLPGVYYVNWDRNGERVAQPAPLPPKVEAGLAQRIQSAAFRAAEEALGPAEFAGVSLVEPLRYELVQRFGNAIKGA